jgi:hypothetical protein
MKVWWSLIKKEFRLMQPFLLINGLVLFISGVVGVYLALQFHSGVPSLILFIAMIWHYIYLLVYLLISLRKERRYAPIWHHSPQSGWCLLSAKFTVGLVMLSLSLTLFTVLWLEIMPMDYHANPDPSQSWGGFPFLVFIQFLVQHNWGLLVIIFLLRALLLAALGVFIYYIRDMIKYFLRGWRKILFPILFGAAFHLIVRFTDTSLYDALFYWGGFDLPKLSFLISSDASTSSQMHHIPYSLIVGKLTLGDMLYRFLLTSFCFYTAGWLLDRKVEV